MAGTSGIHTACGILKVDKSAGMTSHDVVARLRRLSGVGKVGHGGTLDPFATGLLLLLIGKATKLFDLLAPLNKEYRVKVQFGAVSDTGDVDGVVEQVGGTVSREGLEAALPDFRGRTLQKVPVYSAVKVDGEPLYRKARRGDQVDTPSREIEIYRLELISFDPESQRAELAVSCSKGTYIRRLCEDLGAALDTGAYALELRRISVGEHAVSDAATLDELEALPREILLTAGNPAFISCLGALYFLPVREVDAKEARAVSHGRPVPGAEPGPVRVVHRGQLLAVYGPGKEGPGKDAGKIFPQVIMV